MKSEFVHDVLYLKVCGHFNDSSVYKLITLGRENVIYKNDKQLIVRIIGKKR